MMNVYPIDTNYIASSLRQYITQVEAPCPRRVLKNKLIQSIQQTIIFGPNLVFIPKDPQPKNLLNEMQKRQVAILMWINCTQFLLKHSIQSLTKVQLKNMTQIAFIEATIFNKRSHFPLLEIMWSDFEKKSSIYSIQGIELLAKIKIGINKQQWLCSFLPKSDTLNKMLKRKRHEFQKR